VERHGSESYFVIGEGLLSESVGGRERAFATVTADGVPPFRFSRMGPKGGGRQLTEAVGPRLLGLPLLSVQPVLSYPAGVESPDGCLHPGPPVHYEQVRATY
jgi:hypothetical protein